MDEGHFLGQQNTEARRIVVEESGSEINLRENNYSRTNRLRSLLLYSKQGDIVAIALCPRAHGILVIITPQPVSMHMHRHSLTFHAHVGLR